MRLTLGIAPVLVTLAAVTALGTPAAAATPPQPATAYSHTVASICAGALLFNGTHRIGTRAGALAVARDIRRSGNTRLSRVDAVPKPVAERPLLVHWIALEHHLVAMYATNYVKVWNAIERADSTRTRARLPGVLRPLIDQPYPLQRQAAALELTLRLPDCTGGSQPRTATGAEATYGSS